VLHPMLVRPMVEEVALGTTITASGRSFQEEIVVLVE
jgi:hypothetical protein